MKQIAGSSKPLATLSLDLDNKWSYMKTHGDSGWEEYPSYLDIFIPRALDVLDGLGLKITFFIVGQDAALDKNRDSLKMLTKRGHDVGNHSFHHEPWLHLYDTDRIKREIADTGEHILRVTGKMPRGFRGPGFSWSHDLFEVLGELGYIFDATTLPTFIGPLARAYYFWKAGNLSKEERDDRKKLFGGIKDGLRPVKPYTWKLDSGTELLEIPVTTMPVFKMPFHLSYLIYLSQFSEELMTVYLQTALMMCRITKTEPSFLLHPPDLLGKDQVPELSFFPGMDLDTQQKEQLFKKVLRLIARSFTIVDLTTYAERLTIEGKQ
jgi:hypothetical protein